MKALVSPAESFTIQWVSSWTRENNKWVPTYTFIEGCQRVVEVAADSSVFEVALPLHWTPCPDTCVADAWYFKNGELIAKPADVPQPSTPVETLP